MACPTFLPAAGPSAVPQLQVYQTPQRAGGFQLEAAAPIKAKAKQRNTASQYPLFQQLAQFISDEHWRIHFQNFARNSLPIGFRIKDNQLCCRKNNKSFKIPLIFSGFNEQAGLNGLNMGLLQLFHHICAYQMTTPRSDSLLMTPMRIEALATSVRYSSQTPKAGICPWSAGPASFDPHPLAPYYIIAPLLQVQTSESCMIQNYIIYIIEFIRQQSHVGSSQDFAREQMVQQSASTFKFSDLEKQAKNILYENFVNRITAAYQIPPHQLEDVKSAIRLYLYSVSSESIIMENGEIAAVIGLDLSKGIPTPRVSRSSSKAEKKIDDPALKNWRKYLKDLRVG